jgi:hypothetical protein
MLRDRPWHTIAVTARTRSRHARLKTCYPDYPDRRPHDAALARELLARTGELPASKHDLIIVLTEHRHPVHDLATALAARTA